MPTFAAQRQVWLNLPTCPNPTKFLRPIHFVIKQRIPLPSFVSASWLNAPTDLVHHSFMGVVFYLKTSHPQKWGWHPSQNYLSFPKPFSLQVILYNLESFPHLLAKIFVSIISSFRIPYAEKERFNSTLFLYINVILKDIMCMTACVKHIMCPPLTGDERGTIFSQTHCCVFQSLIVVPRLI